MVSKNRSVGKASVSVSVPLKKLLLNYHSPFQSPFIVYYVIIGDINIQLKQLRYANRILHAANHRLLKIKNNSYTLINIGDFLPISYTCQ